MGKFIRRILLGVNLLILILLLVGHLFIPKSQPGIHWPLGLIGLAFPFLVLLTLGFVLFWLIFYYKYVFWSAIVLVICWGSISVLFSFHTSSSSIPSGTDSSTVKVMSYNVHYFKDLDSSTISNALLRNKMLDLIEKQGPDILCLQEFYTSENPNDFNNKSLISKDLKLPYRFFSSNHNYKNNHSGVILFSRFPILHSGKIKLLGKQSKEIAIFADVKINQDTVRLFTVHLQSIYLTGREMQQIEKMKDQQPDNGRLKAAQEIIKKLRSAYVKRGKEANRLAKKVKESPYPVILCGDFNDPPTSYSYFKIRQNKKDAFLEKGFGLGRTFARISPTLRIDYIFTDSTFKVQSFKTIHKNLSDHYPIIARIKL